MAAKKAKKKSSRRRTEKTDVSFLSRMPIGGSAARQGAQLNADATIPPRRIEASINGTLSPPTSDLSVVVTPPSLSRVSKGLLYRLDTLERAFEQVAPLISWVEEQQRLRKHPGIGHNTASADIDEFAVPTTNIEIFNSARRALRRQLPSKSLDLDVVRVSSWALQEQRGRVRGFLEWLLKKADKFFDAYFVGLANVAAVDTQNMINGAITTVLENYDAIIAQLRNVF